MAASSSASGRRERESGSARHVHSSAFGSEGVSEPVQRPVVTTEQLELPFDYSVDDRSWRPGLDARPVAADDSTMPQLSDKARKESMTSGPY